MMDENVSKLENEKSDVAMKEDTNINNEDENEDENEDTDVFSLLHKQWKETIPNIKSQR